MVEERLHDTKTKRAKLFKVWKIGTLSVNGTRRSSSQWKAFNTASFRKELLKWIDIGKGRLGHVLPKFCNKQSAISIFRIWPITLMKQRPLTCRASPSLNEILLRLRSHCTIFCKRLKARAEIRHTDPL